MEKAAHALIESGNLACTVYTQNFAPDGRTVFSGMVDINFPSDCDPGVTPQQLAAQVASWNQRYLQVDTATRRTFADDSSHWIQLRDELKFGLDPRRNEPVTIFREVLLYQKLALMAAGIARTVVFFHGTRWVRDLCICEILRARPTLSRLRELISRWPRAHDRKVGLLDNCNHIPANGPGYWTFLSLGVLLAEIAVVAPIDIEIVGETGSTPVWNGDIRFRLPQQVPLPPGVHNPLTAEQLILHFEQLKPRFKALHVGRGYRMAVEECFGLRARFIDRGNGRFLAGDIDRCIEYIVKP
jgi:hypothetical protein